MCGSKRRGRPPKFSAEAEDPPERTPEAPEAEDKAKGRIAGRRAGRGVGANVQPEEPEAERDSELPTPGPGQPAPEAPTVVLQEERPKSQSTDWTRPEAEREILPEASSEVSSSRGSCQEIASKLAAAISSGCTIEVPACSSQQGAAPLSQRTGGSGIFTLEADPLDTSQLKKTVQPPKPVMQLLPSLFGETFEDSLAPLEAPLRSLDDDSPEAGWLDAGGDAMVEEEAENIKEQLAKRRRQLELKLFTSSSRNRRPSWRESWPCAPRQLGGGFCPSKVEPATKCELFTKREACIKREMTFVHSYGSKDDSGPEKAASPAPAPEAAASAPASAAPSVSVAPASSAFVAVSTQPVMSAAHDRGKSPGSSSCSPGLLKRRRLGASREPDEQGAQDPYFNKEMHTQEVEANMEKEVGSLRTGQRTMRGLPRPELLLLASQLERRFLNPLHE